VAAVVEAKGDYTVNQDFEPRSTSAPKRLASSALRAASGGLHMVSRLLMSVARPAHLYKAVCVDFKPRPDDIFIVSYPRSGTTWLQMILYQLATDGDMNIPHISRRIPFFENTIVFSPRAFDDLPSPRMFKSHLSYGWIPKGPYKYIYIARNGKDVLVSNYHHERFGRAYTGTLSQFTDRFLQGRVQQGSWFKHVAEWYSHRNDKNVLFLTYEELSSDLEASVKKIIEFCGFQVAPDRLPSILNRCSFSFMKQHESKFSPAAEMELQRGINREAFIRKGKVGGWKEYLDRRQEALFERKFQGQLGKLGITFGAASESLPVER